MWVVKIGGSLAYAAELPAWLAALALHGGGRVVIVPGGGPFADLVRRAQAHQGYADASAHAMALLAMAQYGLMMAGIEGRLVAAAGLSQIREVLAAGRVPVWIPGPDGAPGVRASWEVSSDSLALWVAGQMGATDLALVKSRAPSPGVHRAPDLSARRGPWTPLSPAPWRVPPWRRGGSGAPTTVRLDRSCGMRRDPRRALPHEDLYH